MVDVHFDMHELEEVIRRLGEDIEQTALPIIGETLVTAIDELIQSEGATGTQGKWEPFSPATFDLHPRRRGGKLLQDTGLLANIQTKIGPDWVEVESPAPYAKYHHTGTRKNARQNMRPTPQRDFLAIDLDAALEDAAEQIAEVIAKL